MEYVKITNLCFLFQWWDNILKIYMIKFQFFIFFFVFFSAVSCGIPDSPGNGSVIGNEFTLGSRLIYECNEGFKLESSQQATAVCQEDGLWSNKGRPPVCKCKWACISQKYFPWTFLGKSSLLMFRFYVYICPEVAFQECIIIDHVVK